MTRQVFFLFLILVAIPVTCAMRVPQHKNAPKVVARSVDTICYTEEYFVLASNPKIKHGKYALIHKENPIEEGQYTFGKRTGLWQFYTAENELELEYDYDNNKPVKMLPHIGHKYSEDTYPPIFLGSPLHIRHYICTHTTYPLHERGEFKNCQVDVAMHINSEGRFTGYHIQRFSKPDFNQSVMNAMRKIPKNWRWVPAKLNGKCIDSEYVVSIVFEYVQ
ncbi:MAG: energy transducer TonB [Bacteroidia bacterium]|nr:energy transducer TonB [Bacteroidia bacterium]